MRRLWLVIHVLTRILIFALMIIHGLITTIQMMLMHGLITTIQMMLIWVFFLESALYIFFHWVNMFILDPLLLHKFCSMIISTRQLCYTSPLSCNNLKPATILCYPKTKLDFDLFLVICLVRKFQGWWFCSYQIWWGCVKKNSIAPTKYIFFYTKGDYWLLSPPASMTLRDYKLALILLSLTSSDVLKNT